MLLHLRQESSKQTIASPKIVIIFSASAKVFYRASKIFLEFADGRFFLSGSAAVGITTHHVALGRGLLSATYRPIGSFIAALALTWLATHRPIRTYVAAPQIGRAHV